MAKVLLPVSNNVSASLDTNETPCATLSFSSSDVPNQKKPNLPDGIEEDEVEFLISVGLCPQTVSESLNRPVAVLSDAQLSGGCPLLSRGLGEVVKK